MNTNSSFTVLVLAGSYRSGSYNQALVAGVREVAPPHLEIAEFDLRLVPYYDGDVEEAGDPEPVVALKRCVVEADVLLLVTPEYNSGVPGVLKNGIDWISRTYPDAPIGGKIAAVVGATPGRSGTRFAQEQLRQILGRAGAIVMADPQVMIARAGEVIEDGKIVSDELRAQLRSVLDAIVETSKHCAETGSAAVVV